MDDLFVLFPDLPYFRKRPVAERVREIRRRADRARDRMRAEVELRKRAFARAHELRVPRRPPPHW